jgi:hypothetical protein
LPLFLRERAGVREGWDLPRRSLLQDPTTNNVIQLPHQRANPSR